MTLANALNTALTGLRSAQVGIDVVSRNIANASTPDYTKKVAPLMSQTLQGQGAGVARAEITREIDLRIQRELRVEQSGTERLTVIEDALSRLDVMFGRPEDETSFAAATTRLTTSFQALADTPESVAVRQAVIDSADYLADEMNRLSDSVQAMRQEAEDEIAEGVRIVNEALSGIEELNAEIAIRIQTDRSSADLEDERDKLVNQISEQMDIMYFSRGGGELVIMTQTGRTLLDGHARELQFDARTTVGANSLYSADAAQRGVGTIVVVDSDGGEIDLLEHNHIRTGKIAGYLELRDTLLTQAQNQLDEMAHQLARALSAGEVSGTPVTRLTEVDLPDVNTTFPFDADVTMTEFALTVDGIPRSAIDIPMYPATDPQGAEDGILTAVNQALVDMGLSDVTARFETTAGDRKLILEDPQARDLSGFQITSFVLDSGGNRVQDNQTSATTATQYEYTNLDLSSVETPGDAITLVYTDPVSGAATPVTLTLVDPPATSNTQVLTADDPATQAVLVETALNALLPAELTVVRSGNTIEIRDASPLTGTSNLLSFTASSQTATGSQLAVFADGNGDTQVTYTGLANGSLDGQKVGFSQRIAVNEDLRADPGRLVQYAIDSAGTLSDPGDPTRPLDMVRRLSETYRSFDSSLGLGSQETTLERFAVSIVAFQSTQAGQYEDRLTYQTAVTDSLERRFDSVSGVNVDDEMAELLLLERSYQAASQVLNAIQTMYDTLLDAVR